MTTAFETVVYDYLVEALSANFPGVTVIRSEQNGPRPSEYVTYKALPRVPAAFGSHKKTQNEEDEDFIDVDHINRNKVSVSLQAYSENGEAILNEISMATKSWRPRRLLMNGQTSLSKVGTTRDTSYQGDTGYRRRYTLELEFLDWAKFRELRPKVKEITASGNVSFDEKEV